MLVSIWHIFY